MDRPVDPALFDLIQDLIPLADPQRDKVIALPDFRPYELEGDHTSALPELRTGVSGGHGRLPERLVSIRIAHLISDNNTVHRPGRLHEHPHIDGPAGLAVLGEGNLIHLIIKALDHGIHPA